MAVVICSPEGAALTEPWPAVLRTEHDVDEYFGKRLGHLPVITVLGPPRWGYLFDSGKQYPGLRPGLP